MLTLTDVIVSFWMAPVILFILLPLSMLVCSWVITLLRKTDVDQYETSATDMKASEVNQQSLQANGTV